MFDSLHQKRGRAVAPKITFIFTEIRTLGGKPSVTRLLEQCFIALPQLLMQLETYAECELKSRTVPTKGYIGFLGRPAFIERSLAGQRVRVFETYYGLELRNDEGKRYLLRDERRYKQLSRCPVTRRVELPEFFQFEPISDDERPRFAVAL